MILQAEASECGLACLAMIAGYHQSDIDLVTLRQRFQVSLKGATLKHLLAIAEDLGFSGRPLRLDVDDLGNLVLPAILHWDLNHFVVLTRRTHGPRGTRYHIHDPASGARAIGEAEFANRFTGIALELVKSEQFRPNTERAKLKINQLWSRIDGFWPAFRQIFLLSLVLQLIVLVSPFFLQISIDTVLPTFDIDLLLVLALGFGGVAVVSTLTNWVRSLALLRLSTALSYQIVVNLFRHLLRLPLPWFERRHVGDVISRFGSTKAVMDLLSQGLITSLIDGFMAIATLIMMFVYSALLGSLAIAAMILTTALRFGFFAALKQANVSMITANARENSVFIESIRGVSTIKAFGEESNRQRQWQQRKAEAVNAEIKSGRLNAIFNAGEQLVMAIERVLFVYIAVRYSMTGALSVGMIFALMAYRQQFLDAASRLVQQGVSYRLLDMHLMRIADIALSAPEPLNRTAQPIAFAETHGPNPARIALRNVRFRYAPNEPDVIQGINLEVGAGEMIGLVGPSGGGKTTLMKIMMGLLVPVYGEVLIDGRPLASYGLARWRREIGSVAQDDALFAGSLADNITLFDPEPDEGRLEIAARAANIAEDIDRMPMRYHTPVGDMGSVLSGGQKQRVLLARALYRQPRALLLDEATSHLDPQSELRVSSVLNSVISTRILIAHRPQTLAGADRIFMIADGRLNEIQRAPVEAAHSDAADIEGT